MKNIIEQELKKITEQTIFFPAKVSKVDTQDSLQFILFILEKFSLNFSIYYQSHKDSSIFRMAISTKKLELNHFPHLIISSNKNLNYVFPLSNDNKKSGTSNIFTLIFLSDNINIQKELIDIKIFDLRIYGEVPVYMAEILNYLKNIVTPIIEADNNTAINILISSSFNLDCKLITHLNKLLKKDSLLLQIRLIDDFEIKRVVRDELNLTISTYPDFKIHKFYDLDLIKLFHLFGSELRYFSMRRTDQYIVFTFPDLDSHYYIENYSLYITEEEFKFDNLLSTLEKPILLVKKMLEYKSIIADFQNKFLNDRIFFNKLEEREKLLNLCAEDLSKLKSKLKLLKL